MKKMYRCKRSVQGRRRSSASKRLRPRRRLPPLAHCSLLSSAKTLPTRNSSAMASTACRRFCSGLFANSSTGGTHRQEPISPLAQAYGLRKIGCGLDEQWQADLVEKRRLKWGLGRTKFLLVVLDLFSRQAMAQVMASTSGVNVTGGFRRIVEARGQAPAKLQTNQKREFFNTTFKIIVESAAFAIFLSTAS